MKENEYNDRELRLTAAIYARLWGVYDHVKAYGTLPENIPNGGAHIVMHLIINERGTDLTLEPDEQLVYDAILKENRLPGGSAHLVENKKLKKSV